MAVTKSDISFLKMLAYFSVIKSPTKLADEK